MLAEGPHFPIDLTLHAPGAGVFLLSLKLDPEPETISRLYKKLVEMNVDVVANTIVFKGSGKAAMVSCFIKPAAGLEVERVVEEVAKVEGVLDVKFSKQVFNNIAFDTIHFPLLFDGERSVAFKLEGFNSISSALRKMFGSAGEFLLYEMGRRCGEHDVTYFTEKYGLKGFAAAQAILAETVGRGWGFPKVVEFDEKSFEGVVAVEELFECLPYRGSQNPMSHFFRGFVKEVFSQLLGRDFVVRERKCVSMGDGECVFTISLRPE